MLVRRSILVARLFLMISLTAGGIWGFPAAVKANDDFSNVPVPASPVLGISVAFGIAEGDSHSNTGSAAGSGVFGLSSRVVQVDPSDHPALKPVTNPIPKPAREFPTGGNAVNRIKGDELYMGKTEFLGNVSPTAYGLTPASGGEFIRQQAVKWPFAKQLGLGSAVGINSDGKAVLYYAAENPFVSNRLNLAVGYAVDGEKVTHELPVFPDFSSGRCRGWGLGVAPNQTLWFYRSGTTRVNGPIEHRIAQMQPNGRAQWSGVPIAEVEGEKLPENGACAYNAVFDTQGYYYMKVASSSNIIRFDVSQFPKVTFKYLKEFEFKTSRATNSLAYYNGRWWTRESANSITTGVYAVDPVTGKSVKYNIDGIDDGLGVSSAGKAPSTFLRVNNTVDKPKAARGDTVTYTVSVENKFGIAYQGPVTSQLGAAQFDYDPDAATIEIVDAAGVKQADSGSVTGPTDGKLVWSGHIPVGGKLTWSYSLKAISIGDLSSKTIIPDQTASNCASSSDEASCTAAVLVEGADLRVSKSADTGRLMVDGTVKYTITADNRGNKDYVGDVADDLTGVLGKAVYNDDVQVELVGKDGVAKPNYGMVTGPAGGRLTWGGAPIAGGDRLEISFSVRIKPETRLV